MSSRRIAQSGLFSFIVLILLVFQNCGQPQHGEQMSSSVLGANSVAIFEQTLKPVLVTNCGSCHGVSQAPLHSVSDSQVAHDTIMGSRLINMDDPASSRLVVKIQGGHQSIAPEVADEIQTQIAAWVQQAQDSGEGVPTPTPPPATGNASVDLFATTVQPVLLTNCASCHGVNQQPLHSVANPTESHDRVINLGLVDLNTPANSRLVSKIQGGHQGIAQSVATDLTNQITAWVQGGGGAAVTPVVLEATFQSINALILQPKCATCHNPNGTRRQEDYSTYESTIATGKIDGDFWDEIESDNMPRGRDAVPLNAAEKAAIRAWLDAGAPNN